ncbi:MAG TPA: TlpA disulfide reductase family protein [Burkholderiaceae bacterium]|nr:TlpA disulfide reductase family protein [Burkholderiaceae bacterium]
MAPELDVQAWLNAPAGPPTLAGLRGKVVLVHAFQMLCPGCVMHALPQAQRVHAAMRREDFVVLGLHTVFEHHAAMTPQALQVFASEFSLSFPIGIDRQVPGDALPATMAAYAMQGTPTTLLIDRSGRLRLQEFGAIDDFALGVHIGALLAEPAVDPQPNAGAR